MDDLAERIKASIEDRTHDPWFPELTDDLAAHAWRRLQRNSGLTPESYCTERVLSRDLAAHREVITYLRTSPPNCATASTISIEALTEKGAAKYQQQGISFYSPHELLHTTVIACLDEALSIIHQVPSLMRTVSTFARSLHVIRPADEDHDVSFSEPCVPFSIFVSVPEKRVENDALRVAEAIVHETMHLQLTVIDKTSPLVLSRSTKYYSPWRREYRDAEGILHAMYVFGVIERFFERLAFPNEDIANAENFILNRRSEIRRQFENSSDLQFGSDLSMVGTCLVHKLKRA